jgi:hypothetical protein
MASADKAESTMQSTTVSGMADSSASQKRSYILSGQFDDFERAAKVAGELMALGVASDHIEQFFLNAPGQHDQLPMGGDEDADRDAKQGDNGAASGAAIGAVAGIAVGVAAIPLVGPLAAAAGLAAGAYTGSLAGALDGMGNGAGPRGETVNPRPAGVRVVVNVAAAVHKDQVLATFAQNHARSVEEGFGLWRDGSWSDFDPVSVPKWIVAPVH